MDNDNLYERIKVSGLKLKYVADRLGITYQSLRRKLNGDLKFKDYEIIIINEMINRMK